MKIRSIEAENFKLFTDDFNSIKDISTNEMILFNGPNGYGKTSVFDIIEFCLTGEIKRISDYSEELAIAKNEAFDNKILISDESKESFVKLALEDDGRYIEICYSYDPIEKKKGSSKENNPYKIFECFTRKISCNGEEVTSQEEFINNLQFNDIKEVFDKCCFLSQDEHLQFLKTAKKSKADSLSFLFDVPDECKKELESVSEQLDTLKSKRKNSYLKILKNQEEIKRKEIVELEAEIKKYNKESDIVYKRLFTDKEILWDKENVQFNSISYANAKGDLENLLYFSEHKDECVNYLFNNPYAKLLKDFDGGSVTATPFCHKSDMLNCQCLI